MAREFDQAGRGACRAAALLGVLWLAVASSAAARTTETVAPASAWWVAAEMALERGDCARALALLEEQVVEQHPGAIGRLGDIHETGQCEHLGLPPAADYYEQLLADGNALAGARLGFLYLHGLGVRRDIQRAKALFKEAVLFLVAHDFPERRRGLMAETMGRHAIPPELEAELDWADRIEFGPARLLYETALQLRAGDGLPRDEETAYEWLGDAAYDGDLPEAWFALGLWDLERACDQDDRREALWRIAHAATLGYVPAIKEIGLRLAEGRGVRRRDFAAMVLLLKALRAGEDVEAALRDVASRLSYHERVVARKRASKGEYIVTFSPSPRQSQPQPSASRFCNKRRLSF